MKKQSPPARKIQKDVVVDSRQLRADLTKVFVLTMLAVGLELALSYLWK